MVFIHSGPPQFATKPKFSWNVRKRRCGQRQRGLSLVELLVVISILGFLSAIAIPIISNIFNRATTAAAQQTAKQIAQAAVAATAAGNQEIMDSGSLDDAIEAVFDGLVIQIGQESTSYELGQINDEHLDAAKHYLDWQDGVILFCPQGVAHQSVSGNLTVSAVNAIQASSLP